MIKGMNSSSKYLVVHGGQAPSNYVSPGAMGAGMMRYNSNTSSIEINDGNSWQHMNTNYASIELSSEAESLLDWARQKRDEEQQMKAMIEQYPTLKKARDNYDLIWNLVKDEQCKNSV